MQPPAEWSELGRDQLDLRPPPSAGRRWLPYRRLALGGRATATPTLVFVLIGVALGPQGLNILSLGVLAKTRILPHADTSQQPPATRSAKTRFA